MVCGLLGWMAGVVYAAAPLPSAPATVGTAAALPLPVSPLAAAPLPAFDEEGEGGALPGGPDRLLDPVIDPMAAAALSAAAPAPERWTLPAEVITAVRAVRDRSIGERVAAASQSFLGLPYLNDAAGELDRVDPDPPSRFDAFDCLTFVEEVLSIALAGDPLYAPALRDAFRYDGAPSYTHRRHFMEAEWIPAALQSGLLEDITARVGPARLLTKEVTLATWRGWKRRSLFKLPDERLPVGSWALTYLDLAAAAEAVPRIPPGAIVVTLRSDRTYVPIVVTHISLVVPPPPGSPPDAEPRMRHATRMGMRTVRDDRLGWYTEHLRDYVNWPSLGITVLMPREQGPRVSALSTLELPPPFPPAEGPLPLFEPAPIAPFVPRTAAVVH